MEFSAQNTTSPTTVEAAYLETLDTFAASDWLVWVEAVLFFQPRRPIPPFGSVEPYEILTDTYDLLFRYRPLLSNAFQRALVQVLLALPVRPSAVEAYYDLIEVLTSVKPVKYKQPLLDLITNEVSGLHKLTFMDRNIHARLLNIYTYIDDGLCDLERPNSFVTYLYRTTAGDRPVHPAPDFSEYALRYFALRRYNDYFIFLKRITRVYAEPIYVEYICNSLKELVAYHPEAFQDMYNWFKNEYDKSLPDQHALMALKNELKKWLENETFFDNDPFALLLYCELAAGIMPPVAGLLKLVCGMRIPDLVDKDVFDKERIKTLMKWVTVTNRKKEFFDTNYLKVLRSIMDPIHDQTDWSIDLQVVNWYVNFERTGAGYILHSYFVDLTLDGDPANEWQSQHVNVTHKEEYLFQEIFDTIGVNTSPGSDSKLAAYFPEYSLMTN